MGFRIPLISRAVRRHRINALVEQLGDYETAMRDVCAALIELTDPADDLHVEVQRLLEALDG